MILRDKYYRPKHNDVISHEVKKMNEENTNDDGFWKQTNSSKKEEQNKSTEMNDTEISGMNLKTPKPLYKQATRCKIDQVKLFKEDDKQKDSKDTMYTPFFMTVSFTGAEGEKFDETYRGGRLYEDDGKTTVYVGPNSALGRLKKACIESRVEIGTTIKTWATSMENKEVVLQSQIVTFGGKTYEKNYVISFA